jgi:hypothetical protein
MTGLLKTSLKQVKTENGCEKKITKEMNYERMKAEAMKACNGWKNPEMHATVARQSGGISMTTWLMEISWRDNDLQLFIAVVH